MVPMICILNHARISWVSIEIYDHDNFVFGHILMFFASIFAHFCVLCTYLVGKQQEVYGESNHGMLFICWHMLFELNTTICRIAYSIWLGARRITRIGLKIMG